jgi:hypothetical protein
MKLNDLAREIIDGNEFPGSEIFSGGLMAVGFRT